MKFSERLGYKPVKEQLQISSIDRDLKNSLWSVFFEFFLMKFPNHTSNTKFLIYCKSLWLNFFKHPVDSLEYYTDYDFDDHNIRIIKYLRNYLFSEDRVWYEIYDFLEFSSKYSSEIFAEEINHVLDREKAAFRLVGDQFIQITSETEIDAIEQAIGDTNIYVSVNTHLNNSLKLLSDKKAPDYRNSIKESISAVESICKIITKNDKATLGETLKYLEKQNHLHPALKIAFSALYGYTSDEGGIRHALIEDSQPIGFDEAKFMLVTCSSFINFLISRQPQS